MSNDSRGFSLVELMMVIAIVSLLASIAIPNYQNMVARARQSEAKTELAAMFATEQSFIADQGSYTYCLYEAGFEPSPGAQRFYSVGFQGGGFVPGCPGPGYCWITFDPSTFCAEGFGGTVTTCPCNGDVCTWGGSQRNDCTFKSNVLPSELLGDAYFGTDSWGVGPSTFTAGAFGGISSSSILDIWTIDQNQNITNTRPGL